MATTSETKVTKTNKPKGLPSFLEMCELDISEYVKKREKADYLPWASCKMLLHKNGAETVYFEPLTLENGSSLFMSDMAFGSVDNDGKLTNAGNRCYEVRVRIVIDDLDFVYNMPVMNGANPVRDNSMSQQRVNTAQTRAFVKGVAVRTGLGFGLWLGDEDFDDETEDLSKHNLMKIKERFEQLITSKMTAGLTIKDICDKIKVDEEQFTMYLKYFGILDKLEKALRKV